MPITSMSTLYNIARDKQRIKENEFDPSASATGALLKGVSGGLEKREAQPGKNIDMFLKLLDIAKQQGEMKRQQEIDQRNQEVHQQLFGNLNANDDKNTTDKMGKPINTMGSRINKLWETHDIFPKYDSKTGNYNVDWKPKKTTTTSTTKKEFTNFEKGESLRDQVRKEQDSYLRTTLDPSLKDVPYEKKARWNKMIEKADKLQGIKAGDKPSKIETSQEKEEGGRIGKFFKGLFDKDGKKKRKYTWEEDPFDLLGN